MAGEVTFAASEADSVGAQRDWWRSVVFRRSTGMRYAITVVVGAILIAPIAGWVNGWPDDYRPYLFGWAVAAVYLVVFLSVCIGLGYLLLPRRASRLFRQAKMAGKPWTFRWDDEGLSYVAVNGAGQYRWLEFHHWRAGRSATLCFINDNQFVYLPHRALTPDQRDDITDSLVRSGLRRV